MTAFYGAPYTSPAYFIPLLIAILPMAILLLKGRRLPIYEGVFTVFFLYLCFRGFGWKSGVALILYVVWQLAWAKGYEAHRRRANGRAFFYVSIASALLPLLATKIFPIFEKGASHWTFLGISYLTFRTLQVIFEMRDGTIKSIRIVDYLRFLLFFPTISSGPIDRYRRFEGDLRGSPTPEVYIRLLTKGTHAIFMGMLYKFIIGYLLSLILDLAGDYAADLNQMSLWLPIYMYAYTLYLFFDFAGYSLFAVGVANLMGYDIPVNFKLPFLSRNMKDFWNRWHMSLSFWFRDFVYMRLLLTLTKRKVFRSRVLTSNLCYYCLFLLMGLWHGFTWYYIAYGLYHATIICLNDAWLRFKKKHGERIPSNRLTAALSIFITFHAACFSFLIFSGFFDTYLKTGG
jgi:membrane protein involved in D-alanine export